jgi:hypothetical protein
LAAIYAQTARVRPNKNVAREPRERLCYDALLVQAATARPRQAFGVSLGVLKFVFMARIIIVLFMLVASSQASTIQI